MSFLSIKPLPTGLLHMDVVSMSKLSNSSSSPFMQLLCLARRVRAQEAAFLCLFILMPAAALTVILNIPAPGPPCPAQLCCTHTNKEDHTFYLLKVLEMYAMNVLKFFEEDIFLICFCLLKKSHWLNRYINDTYSLRLHYQSTISTDCQKSWQTSHFITLGLGEISNCLSKLQSYSILFVNT